MKKALPIIISFFLLASCGTDLVARVGDIKLTTEDFAFYLNSIKAQMQGTELETDTDWENQEIEGKKAIDVAKEQAMEIAVKNALYIEASKAHGITLDVNDKMNVDRMKSQLISGYGGNDGYKEYLKSNNISDKFIDSLIKSSAYQNKIYRIVQEENKLSDDEVMAYFEESREDIESRYRKAKHILILTSNPQTGTPLTKSEQEDAKKQADSLLERAMSGENFDALMNEFSQDPGLEGNPEGYVFTSGEMVPEFEKAVDSVGYDEITICESDYGFHIIKRLPISYEDVKDKISGDIIMEKVDEKAEAWAEEYDIEIVKYEENYKDIK